MSEGLMMGWMLGVALAVVVVSILIDAWKKK